MEKREGEGNVLSGKLNSLKSKKKRESISDLRVCVGSDTEGVCSVGSGSVAVRVRNIIGIGGKGRREERDSGARVAAVVVIYKSGVKIVCVQIVT